MDDTIDTEPEKKEAEDRDASMAIPAYYINRYQFFPVLWRKRHKARAPRLPI